MALGGIFLSMPRQISKNPHEPVENRFYLSILYLKSHVLNIARNKILFKARNND